MSEVKKEKETQKCDGESLLATNCENILSEAEKTVTKESSVVPIGSQKNNKRN